MRKPKGPLIKEDSGPRCTPQWKGGGVVGPEGERKEGMIGKRDGVY